MLNNDLPQTSKMEVKVNVGSPKKNKKQEMFVPKPKQITDLDRIKLKIDLLLSSNLYEIFMSLVTFLVLYADDVRMLVLTKDDDDGYYYFMIISFFIFFNEIALLSFARPGYLNSFFFYMDLASTLSTIIEIPMVMSGVFGIDFFNNNNSTKFAKAGRASRVSSKATKVVRVVRLIRLVRIAKLYKYAYTNIESKLLQNKSGTLVQEIVGDKGETDKKKIQEKQLVIDVQYYNSKMIPKPQAKNISPNQEKNLNLSQDKKNLNLSFSPIKHSANFDRMLPTPINQRAVMLDMPSSVALHSKISKLQMIEIGEKLIHYEEHQSLQSIPPEQIEVEQISKQNQLLASLPQETKVGKRLSDLTTKRAIMVMFSVMISIPIIDTDTYFTNISAFDTGIQQLEDMYLNKTENIKSQINSSCELYINVTSINGYYVLVLKVDNLVYLQDNKYLSLRGEETKTFASASGNSIIILDAEDESQLNAIFGLLRITFVVVVMVMGAISFSKDSNDLVVIPIENMLVKVKRISNNPLEAASIEEEIAMAEEHMKTQIGKKKAKVQVNQIYETEILERLIVKTGALLAIGFGEAGANIIGQNIKSGGEVNPMIKGTKMFALFGFCDIRNFVDFTEVLEEKVMVFVNEVAHIVHSIVSQYEGAINKNIGDAFLLVWKFPEDTLRLNNEIPEILNLRMVNNIADMALISFIKIFITVRRSANLKQYCIMDEVQARLPNFQMKMGFGLHVGWAIEGAIGSYFKIDASYLSPNVNMSSRLEAATKQYGVYHLVSGPFFRLLSTVAQSKMRLIDRVTVKGSIQPVDFFTFDIDTTAIKGTQENQVSKENKKVKKYLEKKRRNLLMEKIKANQYNIFNEFEKDAELIAIQENYTYDFYSTFSDGINAYLQGRWGYAKKCFDESIDGFGFQDGPSRTLLNYMQQFDFDAPEDWRGYRELTDK